MKAIVFDNKVKLMDIEKPVAKEGESLIEIAKAGICNTDIEITRGYMEYSGVMGHEFVGIVKESFNSSLVGKRVVGEINVGCGDCEFCRSGLERHCYNRSVLGIFNHQGAFAEYLVLPDKNLFIVPDSMSDSQAVFTEPIAAALEILEQVHIQPCDKVAIVGDGKLALLIVQAIQLTGADCTVFGKHESKLAIAEKFGAKTSNDENLKFDIVVEASGKPEGLMFAKKKIKPRGTIVLKSTYASDITINMSQFVVDEINIVGSRCGRFEPALRLIENSSFNTDALIDKEFNVEDFDKAFDTSLQSSLKVILNFK